MPPESESTGRPFTAGNPLPCSFQVKYLFMAEAVDLEDTTSQIDGNGKIQPKEVARSLEDASKAPTQDWTPALSGSSSGMTAPSGISWSGGNWSGTSWSGGAWS